MRRRGKEEEALRELFFPFWKWHNPPSNLSLPKPEHNSTYLTFPGLGKDGKTWGEEERLPPSMSRRSYAHCRQDRFIPGTPGQTALKCRLNFAHVKSFLFNWPHIRIQMRRQRLLIGTWQLSTGSAGSDAKRSSTLSLVVFGLESKGHIEQMLERPPQVPCMSKFLFFLLFNVMSICQCHHSFCSTGVKIGARVEYKWARTGLWSSQQPSLALPSTKNPSKTPHLTMKFLFTLLFLAAAVRMRWKSSFACPWTKVWKSLWLTYPHTFLPAGQRPVRKLQLVLQLLELTRVSPVHLILCHIKLFWCVNGLIAFFAGLRTATTGPAGPAGPACLWPVDKRDES